MNAKKETTTAILLFTGVLLGNCVIFSIVPYLSIPAYGHGLHAFQIMLCYAVVATLCMTPWALKQGRKGLATRQWKLYGFRGLLEYGSFTVSFYSLGYLGNEFTLPMHTALNFMTPLLATVAAALILKEKSGWHTWMALLVGVAGVLVITRPGMIPLSPGVFYVLCAAIGFSLCGVTIKLLTRTESAQHIAFYMLVITMVLALPAGIYHWKTPNLEGCFWLVVIGVIAYLQQIYVAKAISKVPYMVLIPLNFVSLVFATILSFLVYQKIIDIWTFVGAVVILAGTIYNAYRNRQLAEAEARAIQATVA
jgi:drug/metabolite transporter (DMT)-like permease